MIVHAVSCKCHYRNSIFFSLERQLCSKCSIFRHVRLKIISFEKLEITVQSTANTYCNCRAASKVGVITNFRLQYVLFRYCAIWIILRCAKLQIRANFIYQCPYASLSLSLSCCELNVILNCNCRIKLAGTEIVFGPRTLKTCHIFNFVLQNNVSS